MIRKIDKKIDKAYWRFRKLLVSYFNEDYGKETIEISFDMAYDYFFKLCEKLEKGE